MKITIEFDEKQLVQEVMQNMPEYSQSYLRCVAFNYSDGIYRFEEEDGEVHTVINSDLIKGLELMLKAIQNKKLNVGLDINTFTDVCQWDAWATDALVQFAIFGEVIYG